MFILKKNVFLSFDIFTSTFLIINVFFCHRDLKFDK